MNRQTSGHGQYKTIKYSKIIHDTGRALLILNEEKGTTWIPKIPAIVHPLNNEIMIPYDLYFKLVWKGKKK
jgi:hypothetical protein